LKVGDLVQSVENGSGIGNSWVSAGTIGLVIKLISGSGGMVDIMVPKLGNIYTYFETGWGVISESR
jgi:hypothetical protein